MKFSQAMWAVLLSFSLLLLSLYFYQIFAGSKDIVSDREIIRLKEQLEELESESKRLNENNERLIARKQEIYSQFLIEDSDLELKEELDQVMLLAGLTEVRGKGISISIDDKADYDPDKDTFSSIVHDANLNEIITLLTNSGATALAINGIRFTGLSSIYCAGSTILCERERLIPPYVISAVGDQERMYKAVAEDNTLKLLVKEPSFLRISYEKVDELKIPALSLSKLEHRMTLLEVAK